MTQIRWIALIMILSGFFLSIIRWSTRLHHYVAGIEGVDWLRYIRILSFMDLLCRILVYGGNVLWMVAMLTGI